MTQQGHVLERTTRIGAGQRVPTTGERARPAMFEGEGRAACVAHELRTPLAPQRALLQLALADPNVDVATWREIGEDVLGACRQQDRTLEACLTLGRSRCGLSLPIVQAVAGAYDANLTVEALSGGGVKVDVRFRAFVNGLSTLPGIFGGARARGDLDPNSRTFQAAAEACKGVAPDHAGRQGRNASLLGGGGEG